MKVQKIKWFLDSIIIQELRFCQRSFDLNTKTTANISLDMDKSKLHNKVKLSLRRNLGIDLKNSKYTFKDNVARINCLFLNSMVLYKL
jgi:hypothetical protein